MCARVLVVDDDPVNIDLLTYLLSAFGHEAVRALGGASALQESAASVPDLVLCDIQMPEMDGFEVLRRLRDDERFAATPIIGVTALAMVGDREKILAAGFDGYLTKPITPETFVREIERYLPVDMALRQTPVPAIAEAGLPAAPPRRNRDGYALVVDDIPANIDLLSHLINSLGVEVRSVTNIDDALRLARATTPILIVSDIHMPGRGDGVDLLEIVKADAALKNVPFLLISSSTATIDEQRRAVACGVDGLILRPLDAQAILEHLTMWIPMESES